MAERLIRAGFQDIELTSFVSPRWIPQLADAAEVVRRVGPAEGVRLWALVPNRVGLERAVDAGVTHIATFMSASETHNMKNLNRTIRESLAGLQNVTSDAVAEGLTVRSYVSTVFGCPFEGAVPIGQTVAIADALRSAGATQIALGDTTGLANPVQVGQVVSGLVSGGVPLDALAVHFHDTLGLAAANAYAAWEAGVRIFDGSIAGIGGCPYAPGASGNAAMEDLVHMFEQIGCETGVDLEEACAAGLFMSDVLGVELPGRYHRYWKARAGTRLAQSA